MLTVLTALISRRPPVEAIDRDPGIIALLATMVRSARRGVASAASELRARDRRLNEAGLFIEASNAWPYAHRSN